MKWTKVDALALGVELGVQGTGCGSLKVVDGKTSHTGGTMLTLSKKHQAAFTLIELLVVVIIVAVLAAVGIPLLSANVQRARATEAESSAGTIRTALRAYLSENNTFPGTSLTLVEAGMNPADLDGRWFDAAAFSIATTTGITRAYCIDVNGATTGVAAAQKAQVSGANLITRSMDEDGTLYGLLSCAGTPLN